MRKKDDLERGSKGGAGGGSGRKGERPFELLEELAEELKESIRQAKGYLKELGFELGNLSKETVSIKEHPHKLSLQIFTI